MRVIIAGTRRSYCTATVRNAIRESTFDISLIISGGAAGVDQAAIDIALIDGIPYTIFDADWDRYGKRAGPVRNQLMAEALPDSLIALPDKESIGTWDMINRMMERDLPCFVKEI